MFGKGWNQSRPATFEVVCEGSGSKESLQRLLDIFRLLLSVTDMAGHKGAGNKLVGGIWSAMDTNNK